jgi:hypothetical protein
MLMKLLVKALFGLLAISQAAAANPLVRLDFPVDWQTTRAKFDDHGASTHTESFRETWIYEVREGGVATLISSRATVPVYRSGVEAGQLPRSVVVRESDFAKLVGIREPIGAANGLVSLHIGRSGHDEIVFSLSEHEHLAVQFEIGRQSIHY